MKAKMLPPYEPLSSLKDPVRRVQDYKPPLKIVEEYEKAEREANKKKRSW